MIFQSPAMNVEAIDRTADAIQYAKPTTSFGLHYENNDEFKVK